MSSRRYAFTLVELLIVISIIALLLSILLTSGGAIVRLARQTTCASQLRALGEGLLAYTNLHGDFPPVSNTNSYNFLIAAGGQTEPDFSGGFGPLSWERRIGSDYYICPLASYDTRNWWHDNPVGMSGYPNQNPGPPECPWWHHVYSNPNPDKIRDQFPKINSFTRASYSLRSFISFKTTSWLELDGWSGSTSPWTYPNAPASVKGKRALIADMMFAPEVIANAHGDGVNVFYLDGSVAYRTDDILLDNGLTTDFDSTPLVEIELIWNSLDK